MFLLAQLCLNCAEQVCAMCIRCMLVILFVNFIYFTFMFSIRFFISRYVRSSRPIGAPRSMYLDDFHWFDAFFFADRCCRSIVIVRVTHWWEYHKKWNWKMASGFHEHERLVDMRTLHLKWMQRYMELETNKKKDCATFIVVENVMQWQKSWTELG